MPLPVIDLAARRLSTQRLVGRGFDRPVDWVRQSVAVQSQDYAGAKWALGMRVPGLTDAEVDRLFDAGEILRLHVLRPTWHFVLPDDVGWLVALTAPRILHSLALRHRSLELDEHTTDRALDVVGEALVGSRHLTRSALMEVLSAAGIDPAGQRGPHLLMAGEMRGLLVSGPRRGAQHTYALRDERVPAVRRLDADAALAELARRYFSGHGPAGLNDFACWSGLTMTEGKRGIAAAGSALRHEVVDGRDLWSDPAAEPVRFRKPAAHLLPSWDEYTVGYRVRDHALLAGFAYDFSFFSFESILSNVVLIDGRVRGAWSRALTPGTVRVEVRPLAGFAASERRAAEAAAAAYGRFLQRSVEVTGL